MSSTSSTNRCDVCHQKNGFRGIHKLVTCGKCGVAVHEKCYGLVPSDGPAPFECRACQAVGKPIVGRYGQEEQTVVTKQRPTACQFCSVDHGVHAMQPLFDKAGSAGRQMIVDKKGYRDLAWVHTLCALFLCNSPLTSGMVFGAQEDGDIDVDSDAGGGDDDSDDTDIEKEELHHFVLEGNDTGDDQATWLAHINEFRKGLKCILCGKVDGDGKTLRIPIQCSYGDEGEIQEFRQRHQGSRDTCYLGAHIGCAMWGKDEAGEKSKYKRVFYYPGGDDDNPNLTPEEQILNKVQCCCYCPMHAEEIHNKNPKRLKKNQQQTSINKKGSVNSTKATGTKKIRSNDTSSISQGLKPPVAKRQKSDSSAIGNSTMKTTTTSSSVVAGSISASTSGSTSRRSAASWLREVQRDVENGILQAKKEKRNLSEETAERKLFWKKKTELSEIEFKILWKDAKENIKKSMKSKQKPQPQPQPPLEPHNIKKSTKSKQKPQPQAPPPLEPQSPLRRGQWDYLWQANYDNGFDYEFKFEEWDSCELITGDEDSST
eukprot:CAMPEP_0198297642 /NCGR_PEP_ID=MMETSP1449-20131203/37602_1 /TAXON_ID=420275 /ORGANISM="Attheya septentrionalis, Strain CCMP2084" /LENGTH=542 /DNA_ID=CAMNT_0043998653 /DNA_START=217 /DNA_END=1845 /DNA_ORIENTATION=-